ncbi:hypothetical protein PoB_006181800 [Plakobranchus ocellatus]|uniref:Uncharacterized protein n=1 Tax=Plakobranchus ocellatus TaxID=259542 RepID=A0AAV4CTV9_9GAST|nr:hypothetical protein PoB_006181800 [Plakobranchus ocellatus]
MDRIARTHRHQSACQHGVLKKSIIIISQRGRSVMMMMMMMIAVTGNMEYPTLVSIGKAKTSHLQQCDLRLPALPQTRAPVADLLQWTGYLYKTTPNH